MKNEQKKSHKKDKDAMNFNMKESKIDFKKGEKEFKRRNYQGAYTHLFNATEICQENHEAHALLAEILIELKDYVKAHQHLETAIHYSQNGARYRYLKGKVYYSSGQWEDALGEFKEAVQEDGQNKEVVYPFMVAEMYFKLGKYKEAIESYNDADKAASGFDSRKGHLGKYSGESVMLADVHFVLIHRTRDIRYFWDVENHIVKKES